MIHFFSFFITKNETHNAIDKLKIIHFFSFFIKKNETHNAIDKFGLGKMIFRLIICFVYGSFVSGSVMTKFMKKFGLSLDSWFFQVDSWDFPPWFFYSQSYKCYKIWKTSGDENLWKKIKTQEFQTIERTIESILKTWFLFSEQNEKMSFFGEKLMTERKSITHKQKRTVR